MENQGNNAMSFGVINRRKNLGKMTFFYSLGQNKPGHRLSCHLRFHRLITLNSKGCRFSLIVKKFFTNSVSFETSSYCCFSKDVSLSFMVMILYFWVREPHQGCPPFRGRVIEPENAQFCGQYLGTLSKTLSSQNREGSFF